MEWTFERLSTGLWQPELVGSYFADKGLCGVSGNAGLLRFHDAQSGPIAQQFVDHTFGSLGVHAEVFAFDWRAKQFALSTSFDTDGSRVGHGEAAAMIVALDPFDIVTEPWGLTIGAFESVISLEVVQQQLKPELFEEWRRVQQIEPLSLTNCAGSIVPGFYGGELAASNLELNNNEVYFAFVQQLWDRASRQQPGAPAPSLDL
ncbi:hypothetical protein ACPXCG_15750 [Gordonia sp. DT218]|uniref:hypothetical protein n=1 Tax=Gordonia sp. DT218 TaxID=3416659 RepID=UPI003CEC4DE8